MSYAGSVLSEGIRRTLTVQAILTTATAVAFLALGGALDSAAAAYGGGISILIAALLGWRVQRASEIGNRGMSGTDAAATAAGEMERTQANAQLFIGAAERFIVVGVGFGAGIALLKLPPVAMITGFAVAQMSFLLRVPTRVDPTKKPGVTP